MGKVKQKNIIISCYEQQPFHVELISSKVAAMNKQMFEHVRGQREKKACFHVQDVFLPILNGTFFSQDLDINAYTNFQKQKRWINGHAFSFSSYIIKWQ